MTIDVPQINTSPALERKITCMAGVTFNPVLRMWLDEARTVPDPLAGSEFFLEVKNKAGELILDFSVGDGFTITNGNHLEFLKTDIEMDIAPGQYTYNFQRKFNDVVTPYTYGDFVITKNTNTPIPIV